ncbi:hypothetical protein HMPREF9489_0592 [Finegoldia magna SY403409CC001050417]|uniref:hypothetical protein n=1 Tax=Finegoldia magna TaxID=1260 RepID=UPI00021A29C7|nr:hypothetical protein [Finegoldia magna]EGS34231.1 hypothetical protein HMPREF9489_0592 [Finegoldia magna SY403409CC001050417]MDU4017904.1 hypothetical protein [Finegoldia magna]
MKTGTDPFGADVVTEKATVVDNVLVAPLNSDELVNELNLTGRRISYILGIPKGDSHNWENAIVEFFDDRFKTVGSPTQGIEDMIPLQWNKKVKVERIE